MRNTLLFLGLLALCSCTSKPDPSELHLLNGYWEITAVVLSDGTKKEYKVNTTIDYIEVDSLKGFRKKVDPKFNGTFETSDDAEPFTFAISKDTIFMHYKNGLSTRKEILKTVSKSSFSVQNLDGITYTYNRYEPINITP